MQLENIKGCFYKVLLFEHFFFASHPIVSVVAYLDTVCILIQKKEKKFSEDTFWWQWEFFRQIKGQWKLTIYVTCQHLFWCFICKYLWKVWKKMYLHVKNISVNVHEDGLFMITAEFCIMVHILLKSGPVTEHLQCIAVFIYF